MAGEMTIGKLIVRVAMDAAGYDTEADKVEKKTSNMGKLLKRTSDLIGGVFVAAAKAGTAALAGLAAASTLVGANFEKAISKVAAVKGIEKTSEDFQRLEEQARRLGATTLFSATEAAEGMEELARAGLSVDEIISASNDTLKLAAATDISLADAASIVASSMAQFGLEASDTARITDVMTVATQNSLFSMNDLAEAMKYAGTAGAAVGFSIEETTAAVAQFRDLGLEGSMAGTQFRIMMSALVSPTTQAQAALEDMGLTIADVNPEAHSFKDILLTLGEAGMTSAQALTIFSQRAGLNVQKLVTNMRDSTEDFDTLFTALQQSAGATSDTYEIMTDNVAGKFAELRSAAEEFLLGIFDTFKGPLADLLSSVGRLVRLVGIQVSGTSDGLTGFGDVLSQLASWIDDNAQTWAVQIGNVLHLISDIANLLSRTLLPVLEGLLPIAAELGVLLFAAFAAPKIAAFVAGTYTVVTALWSAVAAAGGLGAAITAATGGINLLTAAIAAAITAIGLYTVSVVQAKEETRSLADEQERLAALQAVRDRTIEVGIARRLADRKLELQVEREALDLSTEAGRQRDAEIAQYLEMSAQTAVLRFERGELLVVDGKLITTQETLTRQGQAGMEAYAHQVERAREHVSELAAALEEAEESGSGLSAITDLTTRLDAAQRRLSGLEDASRSAGEGLARTTRSAEDLEAALAELQGRTDGAKEDLDTVVDKAARMAQMEAATVRRAADQAREVATRFEEERTEIARQQAEERVRIEREEYNERAKERARIEERAQSVLERVRRQGMTEAERLEREYQLDVVPEILSLSLEEQAEIRAHYDKLIEQSAEKQKKKSTGVFKAIGKAAKAAFNGMVYAANMANKAFGSVLGIVEKLTGFTFSLSAGMQEVTAALEEASTLEDGTTQKLDPAEVTRIAEDAATSFMDGLIQNATQFMTAFVAALPRLIDGLVAAIPVLLQSIVEGFPLIIEALVDGIPQVVRELISAVPQLVQALAEGIPPLVATLVTLIPEVVQGFVAALPIVVQAVAESIPGLVTAVVGQLPDVVQGLIDALPPLIDALFEAAKGILAFVAGSLPTMITKLVASLADIISQILASVPEIVTELLAAVPAIVRSVLDSIPVLITAVLGGLPDIIVALIDGLLLALPDIIIAVVESVPTIILAVTQAIPAIVMAVVDRVPSIISALIGMIPDVIIAVVEALPLIIEAVVALIPDLVLALVQAIPDIIFALFEAFFVELPQQMPRIIVAIVEGLVQAIVEAVSAVWEFIANLFKSLFTKDSDGDGVRDKKDADPNDPSVSYSGINYVPATMRMTVHEGEAVIPSNRNPARGGNHNPALAGSVGFQGGGGGAGGGDWKVGLQVLVDGQVVDRAVISSAKNGRAPHITNMVRKETGTKVGFDPGRFSQWTK